MHLFETGNLDSVPMHKQADIKLEWFIVNSAVCLKLIQTVCCINLSSSCTGLTCSSFVDCSLVKIFATTCFKMLVKNDSG